MFFMNSKIRSRKIGYKAYFKAILHYFGLLPLPGSTADGFGGGSGIICHSLFIIPAFFYPVIHDSFILFFEIHDSFRIALFRKLKTIFKSFSACTILKNCTCCFVSHLVSHSWFGIKYH